jgi:hypothetical protein
MPWGPLGAGSSRSVSTSARSEGAEPARRSRLADRPPFVRVQVRPPYRAALLLVRSSKWLAGVRQGRFWSPSRRRAGDRAERLGPTGGLREGGTTTSGGRSLGSAGPGAVSRARRVPAHRSTKRPSNTIGAIHTPMLTAGSRLGLRSDRSARTRPAHWWPTSTATGRSVGALGDPVAAELRPRPRRWLCR